MPTSRRDFLLDGGRLVLVLPLGFALSRGLAACGDECGGAGDVKRDSAEYDYTSSCESGHTHTFSISDSELSAPAANGISRDTSKYEGGHSHVVELTQQDLTAIEGGGTVTKQSGSASGHTHSFDFRKA